MKMELKSLFFVILSFVLIIANDGLRITHPACQCGTATCELVSDLIDLVSKLDSNRTLDLEVKNLKQKYEIKNLQRKVDHLNEKLNRCLQPVAESLIMDPNEFIYDKMVSDHERENSESKELKRKMDSLMEKMNVESHLMQNLSVDVSELQEENRILKEELREEKRVRRSLNFYVQNLEEGLNQTQSLMQKINEKVSEKDSENYTRQEEQIAGELSEVKEIVFVKLSELDGLNKEELDSRMKYLEYKVNDVYRNETNIVQRLNNVEALSAVANDLLGNGSLSEKLQNLTSVVEYLEESHQEKSMLLQGLSDRVFYLNASLEDKLSEMKNTVLGIVANTTLVSESLNELQENMEKMNETFNTESLNLHGLTSSLGERIENASSDLETISNLTKFEILLVTSTLYEETFSNLSKIKSEIATVEKELPKLKILTDQVREIEENWNFTVTKSDLSELAENFQHTNQSLHREMQEIFTNFQDAIQTKSDEISSLNEVLLKNTENASFVYSIVSDLVNKEQQLKRTVEKLGNQVQLTQDQISTIYDLETEISNMSAKLADVHREVEVLHLLTDELNTKRDSWTESEKELLEKMKNMDSVLREQMEVTKRDLEDLKEKQEKIMMYFENVNQSTTTEETNSRSRNSETEPPTILPVGNACSIPKFQDPHLRIAYRGELVNLVPQEFVIPSGDQLIFSCEEIGKYVIRGEDVLICDDGNWSSDPPTCLKLVEEHVIKEAATKSSSPCPQPRGQFPDPNDCKKYFDCWDGKIYSRYCPSNLHFNSRSRKCDYPTSDTCFKGNTNGWSHAERSSFLNEALLKLSIIIPPISVDPKNIDRPFGLMATSATGELIVYPRTTFTLNCLYPSILGETRWEVTTTSPSQRKSVWETRDTKNAVEAYKLSLSVVAASEMDSGNYTCLTPLGQRHTVGVLVQEIHCPSLDIDSQSSLEVSYKLHPNSPERAMTTQAKFSCREGYSLKSPIDTITCLPSGEWTAYQPRCERDPGCPRPNLNHSPGLGISPDLPMYSIGQDVYYQCSGDLDLEGSMSNKCKKNGEWAHKAHPKCTFWDL